MNHRGISYVRLFAAVILLITWMTASACAACDTSMLMSEPGAQIFTVEDTGLAIRTRTMPFFGTCDTDDWEMNLFIDFVDLYAEEVTAIRITAATSGWDTLDAAQLSITVGKKTYTFTPSRLVSEYDLSYYEDFYVCLGDEGLELIKALMKGKGKCSVQLTGSVTLKAEITIPADDVSSIYNLYKKAGGTSQELSAVDARWAMTVSK